MTIDSRDVEQVCRRLEDAGIEYDPDNLGLPIQFAVNSADLSDAERIATRVACERASQHLIEDEP